MKEVLSEDEARLRLNDPDLPRAEAAFAVLEPGARAFLRSYLRKLLPEADAEDVAQETLLKVWRARSRFRDGGRAAWLAFLKRIADHARVDLLRARGETAELPPELADEELREVDRFLSQLVSADRAAECLLAADRLWLELGSLPVEELRRRLLAAQLFYREGAGAAEILDLLNASRPGAPAGRTELDDWLQDPGVLRLLCCRELYRSGRSLAEALLARGTWSDAEARIIGWRLALGLSEEQISARADCPLGPAELRDLGVRLRAALPFLALMEELLELIERRGRIDAAPHLARPGVWQRLAFQYRYWDDLPHRDILDRVAPPAGVVGYEVTPGMLNVWLSGGRLLRRLARFLEPGSETR